MLRVPSPLLRSSGSQEGPSDLGNAMSRHPCHRVRCFRRGAWPGCKAKNAPTLALPAASRVPRSPLRNLACRIPWKFCDTRCPQAFPVFTAHDRCSGWHIAYCYPQANSSACAVPHRIATFLHVAIHKKQQVPSPFLLRPGPPPNLAGLLEETRCTPE
jgi:hypothetical protein